MNIIFDFDYTLFDTTRFLNALCEKFSRHAIDKDVFYKGLALAYDTKHIFRPSHFLRILAKDSHKPYKLLEEECNSFCSSLHAYVYPDVIPFLHMLQKNRVFLLTFGDEKFQKIKIEGAGIVPYVKQIIITENVLKDKEAGKCSNGKEALFVDDNPLALTAVKRYAPHIITVRMKRVGGEHIHKPSGKGVDYEIKELSELIKFI